MCCNNLACILVNAILSNTSFVDLHLELAAEDSSAHVKSPKIKMLEVTLLIGVSTLQLSHHTTKHS